MPRVYRGAFAEARIQHPVTGVWIVVVRDEPTTELDDIGDDVDLGCEWETVPAPTPPLASKPKADSTPKDGDV